MPGIMEGKISEIINLYKPKSYILLYMGILNVMFNICNFYFSICPVELSASQYHWMFNWKTYVKPIEQTPE